MMGKVARVERQMPFVADLEVHWDWGTRENPRVDGGLEIQQRES